MPKKTKKEKIIADYRKRLKLLEQKSPTAPVVSPIKSAPASIPNVKNVPVSINSSHAENMLVFFKKDFRKSLILIVGIIGLEICLYFATINQYFKFR